MTLTKSLLLGTSAALLAVAGAQAADLPSRKAAPVEYVRVCDAYGTGFYWIPGTDTCLKIGGRVRMDTWFTPAKSAVQMRSSGGPAFAGAPTPGLPGAGVAGSTFTSSNGVNQLGWYARNYLMMDARTQSAWGTVQTVLTMRLSAGTGLAQSSSSPLAVAGSTGPTIEAAYIRFAGFTIGQAASNFTFLPTSANYHSIYSAQFPSGIRQLAYTATFGGGFSATIALENRGDATTTATANALGFNPYSATASTATAAGPQRLPALVGNLRIDQRWGSAMLSGMVQQNTANFASPGIQAVTNGLGPLVTKTGWAVSGGIKINLPMLATGDSIQGWVAYGVGALSYVAVPSLNSNSLYTPNYLGGFLRNDRDMTIYCVGVGCTSYGAEQTAALNIAGIFTHYWTPSLRSNFVASYLRITPGRVTRNTDWANGGLSNANVWSVQSSLIWSPVKNFDIGIELAYARLSQSLTGFNGGLPTAVPCTAAAPMCNASISPNNWTGRMRVERTF